MAGLGRGITFRASLGCLEPSVQHQLKGKRHVVNLPRKQEGNLYIPRTQAARRRARGGRGRWVKMLTRWA